MNASRTSWAWSGRVCSDSTFANGCAREEMRGGGPGKGSIIMTTYLLSKSAPPTSKAAATETEGRKKSHKGGVVLLAFV